ncbi:hypothetical protein AB6D11_06375 [Vibrio splendidus]
MNSRLSANTLEGKNFKAQKKMAKRQTLAATVGSAGLVFSSLYAEALKGSRAGDTGGMELLMGNIGKVKEVIGGAVLNGDFSFISQLPSNVQSFYEYAQTNPALAAQFLLMGASTMAVTASLAQYKDPLRLLRNSITSELNPSWKTVSSYLDPDFKQQFHHFQDELRKDVKTKFIGFGASSLIKAEPGQKITGDILFSELKLSIETDPAMHCVGEMIDYLGNAPESDVVAPKIMAAMESEYFSPYPLYDALQDPEVKQSLMERSVSAMTPAECIKSFVRHIEPVREAFFDVTNDVSGPSLEKQVIAIKAKCMKSIYDQGELHAYSRAFSDAMYNGIWATFDEVGNPEKVRERIAELREDLVFFKNPEHWYGNTKDLTVDRNFIANMAKEIDRDLSDWQDKGGNTTLVFERWEKLMAVPSPEAVRGTPFGPESPQDMFEQLIVANDTDKQLASENYDLDSTALMATGTRKGLENYLSTVRHVEPDRVQSIIDDIEASFVVEQFNEYAKETFPAPVTEATPISSVNESVMQRLAREAQQELELSPSQELLRP